MMYLQNESLWYYNIINEDIEKIEELCKEYERDMPTEMKLIYDAKSGSFKLNTSMI